VIDEHWHPNTGCPQAAVDGVYRPVEVERPTDDHLANDVRCPSCGTPYRTVVEAVGCTRRSG
jgi:hypothetical protein